MSARWLSGSVALLGLFACGGCEPDGQGLSVSSTPPTVAQAVSPAAAASALPPERVLVGKPTRKLLALSTMQPGRIEAFEQTPLFAKVSGFVAEVRVDLGDKVEKDQVLVVISVPEMHDDLKQQTGLLAQADAGVQQAAVAIQAAAAAVKTAQAKVTQAEAGTTRSQGELARWEAEFTRIKGLAQSGTVTSKLADETQQQLRAAEAAAEEAKAAVAAALAGLEEAHIGVRRAEADQQAAVARQQVAQANLDRTRTLLDYTQIKAPFAGVVVRRSVDTGHLVSPPAAAMEPLLVVCRTDTVRIFVEVPELDAEWVTLKDPAVVRIQALGNRSFPAEVTRLAWSLDASNRTLQTEIDIPNSDGVLRPGMFASATLTLEERPQVLVLPAVAIAREGAETFCYRVDQGRLKKLPIETGLRVGGEVEVCQGLSPDDVVVLGSVAALKPDQEVTPSAPEKK